MNLILAACTKSDSLSAHNEVWKASTAVQVALLLKVLINMSQTVKNSVALEWEKEMKQRIKIPIILFFHPPDFPSPVRKDCTLVMVHPFLLAYLLRLKSVALE